MRNAPACCFAVIVLSCIGCSPRADIALTKSSALEFGFSVLINGPAAEMVNSFVPPGGALFSTAAIESRLKANGFDSVSITASTNTRLAFTAKAASAQKVFATAPKAIAYSPAQGAKDGILAVTLSPETAGEILALFPPEAVEFLSLFLSPLLTPDDFSDAAVTDEKSYLDGIRATYGSSAADAIAAAEFTVSVAAPGTIVAMTLPPFAKASNAANKLTMTMPLASLLSLTKPAVFGIRWN